ncbi:MAG: sigma 54-interacting transcriptional regulator [Lachnospiraceae bacterium]|nr:sigma 54-interacting transcriptional regulator [Lachnospiraceae bacterium]
MPSILVEIQETVKKYAQIMSKVAQVEVEVVDENLFRVAGTGFFAAHINEDMSQEGYVYQHILRTGSREIIYNPGKEKLCKSCPKQNICQEEIEISMPIQLGKETIGVIGLVGSSREQKERVLDNESMYLELLEQIADFISVKAAEVAELKKRTTLLNTLDCVINHVERGILIFGRKDQVSAANDAARRQLSVKELEGKCVTVTATGDSLNHENEYQVVLDRKKFFVMGHLYDLEEDPRQYSRVLIFESTRTVQERYYEMTNMVSHAGVSNIIGRDPKTMHLQEEILQVAKSTSTVLITGESGTGKEMVATAIWKASDRKDKRFIAINCGAIPEPLLESELFGYVKGAFTGADPNGRMGKFELANKGVIFLDEIGDMPLYLQVKLLRVLQERRLVRIGSNQLIPLDIRIIAATNKDLKKMIEKNQFREDLYYRLNVIPLRIAPLRERREDIRELVYHFANRYAGLFKRKIAVIQEETMERLLQYPWYGNVRELENSMEFMINMMGNDGILDSKTLPEAIREYSVKKDEEPMEKKDRMGVICLKELEKREIKKALKLFGEDTEGKKRAAKALGISLATLYRKMEVVSQSEN